MEIEALVCSYVADLQRGEAEREVALLELSKARDRNPGIAVLLWHSFGTMTILVEKIIQNFPHLPRISQRRTSRMVAALCLLQSVACHPETKTLFVRSCIALLPVAILRTAEDGHLMEHVRITALGVLGAMMKVADESVIRFLRETEIIPLCLQIMQNGGTLAKTVAIFILHSYLCHEEGLHYICDTAERFYAVASALEAMVETLVRVPSNRQLKYLISCYLRLCDHPQARRVFELCFPAPLMSNPTLDQVAPSIFYNLEDESKRQLQQIVSRLGFWLDAGKCGCDFRISEGELCPHQFGESWKNPWSFWIPSKVQNSNSGQMQVAAKVCMRSVGWECAWIWLKIFLLNFWLFISFSTL